MTQVPQEKINQEYAKAFYAEVKDKFASTAIKKTFFSDSIVKFDGTALALVSWQNTYGIRDDLNQAYSKAMREDSKESKVIVKNEKGHDCFKHGNITVNLTELNSKLPKDLELHKKLSLHDLVILYAAAVASETTVRQNNKIYPPSFQRKDALKDQSQIEKIKKQIEDARKHFMLTTLVEFTSTLPEVEAPEISQLSAIKVGISGITTKNEVNPILFAATQMDVNQGLLKDQRKAIKEGIFGLVLTVCVGAIISLDSTNQFSLLNEKPMYESLLDKDPTAITLAVIAAFCVGVGIYLAVDGYKKYQKAAAHVEDKNEVGNTLS